MVGEAAHGQLRLHSVAQSAEPVSIEEGEGEVRHKLSRD